MPDTSDGIGVSPRGIDVRDVEVALGGQPVLRGVDLQVAAGQFVTLVGPNGAGKTTLVNQITGDMLPDSGNIRYKSQDVTNLRAYQRSRLGIGRSRRQTHLVPIGQ